MALKYTLHTIVRGKERISAGIVAEFSDKDGKEMQAVGAVREPTQAELDLYRMANPESVEPAKDDSKKKGNGKAKGGEKSETEQKGDQPSGDADPDVTEGGETPEDALV